jgi:hypothetical protein
MGDLLDLVVVQVEEDETWERHKVLDLGDVIMLQIQQT